jgi:hypothetical protein
VCVARVGSARRVGLTQQEKNAAAAAAVDCHGPLRAAGSTDTRTLPAAFLVMQWHWRQCLVAVSGLSDDTAARRAVVASIAHILIAAPRARAAAAAAARAPPPPPRTAN